MIFLCYFILVIIIGTLSASYLYINAEKYGLSNYQQYKNVYEYKNDKTPCMASITGYSLLIGVPWIISIPVILLYKLGKKLFNKKSPQQNTKQI